ncbi:ACT domain-containing protein [Aspergillus granulosus]|uniref:ACT domain-containing protein n=1 Tax=Aspergillus granulosus TaxID=176169 RepID=A0ABR4HMV1_9EURO
MAPGESNLKTLLSSLKPILHTDLFVFLTIPNTTIAETIPNLHTLQPHLLFQETEGTTVVVTRDRADSHGFTDYIFPCRMITISVHSSLEAVGLTAAISAKLKDIGVSANVVSGFYHDHIFVPDGREEVAVRALRDLAQEN